MSMEHKAFLFDTKYYHEHLEDIIKKCCKTGNLDTIKTYIDKNYQHMFNPYTGDELDSDWESEMSSQSMQELFEFVLTCCYEPDKNIGLEYAWDGVMEAIKELGIMKDAEKCVLGKPLIYSGITIDPGLMGLGIVEHTEVSRIKDKLLKNQEKLENAQLSEDILYELEQGELVDAYDDLCMIYKRAEKEGKGILFTF